MGGTRVAMWTLRPPVVARLRWSLNVGHQPAERKSLVARIGGVALLLSIQSLCIRLRCVGFAQFEWHAECFTMMRCNHSIISREHLERSQHSRGPASARSHW